MDLGGFFLFWAENQSFLGSSDGYFPRKSSEVLSSKTLHLGFFPRKLGCFLGS